MECFPFVKVLKCGEVKSDCLKLNLEDCGLNKSRTGLGHSAH